MQITNTQQPHKQGFALLFAVLTGSMLLAVGLAIFSIALKELDLSTAGRESQYAFYAADSGLECALYHDGLGLDIFPTNNSEDFSIADVNCPNSPEYLPDASSADSTSALTTFTFEIPQSAGAATPCAIVSVTKRAVPGGEEGAVATTIVSRGYNTCRAGSQQVERALQAVY